MDTPPFEECWMADINRIYISCCILRSCVCGIENTWVNLPPFKECQTVDMKGFSRRLVVLRSKLIGCVVINRGWIVVEGGCMCNLEVRVNELPFMDSRTADINRLYVYSHDIQCDLPMYAQFHRNTISIYTHLCISCWYPMFDIPWMAADLPMYSQFHIHNSSIYNNWYIFC